MADRSVELFSAIYAALRDDATLTALIGAGRVFDNVPAGTSPPYINIGDETATDLGSSLTDGQEHTITIHVWSEQPSSLEVKRIMAAIRDVLHERPPTLSAGTCSLLRQDFKDTLRDPDGFSHHGVLRFRANTN